MSYYNNSRYTFTWTQGRRLASATLGTKSMTFTYNDAGLRTSKTVDGVTTEYFYSGSLLMAQQTADEILMFYYAFLFVANHFPKDTKESGHRGVRSLCFSK